MQRLFGIAFGAFVGLAALTSAASAQSTINDCEKIQAADAYNQCLAKFGPTSKLQNLEPGRPSDFKNNGEEAAAGSGPAMKTQTKSSRSARHSRGRGSHRASHGGGRKRMVISVGRRRHR